MSWEKCVCDSTYEIFTEYPYQIRRIDNKRIVHESVQNDSGYVQLKLNKKPFRKHRVVAMQWIPNPDGYGVVDHINNIKTDNRVENLRWCSYQMNNNNLSTQNFVDEISGDCILVDKYNNWEFDFLYFDPETNDFYVYNGLKYVVKPRYENKYGNVKIYMNDKNNKLRQIYYNKFKKQYSLI